jgi:transposase
VHRTPTEIVLRPHKLQMWLHSKDPLFKEKVNDIVGLDLEPPPGAVVLSIDEKTSIQALERPYQTKLARPGRPGRHEFEYVRHGTTSLMAAFNVQSGEVVHALGPTRTGDDLVAFMEQVATRYDDAERIIVIWDNLSTHLSGKNERWAAVNARHGNRFEFHDTPIHASWLNQVEVFFSILQKVCLRWRSCRSVAELEAAVHAFIARWNEVDGHPFHWTFRGYPLQSEAA